MVMCSQCYFQVNHKNIFIHPKNDYKELWIVMSKAYVVRKREKKILL